MNLYILRHGLAEDRKVWKGADADRPLTKEGISKMKKGAKGMRHLDLGIDWILTSPYRRAYDTAMIVAKEFKLKKKLKMARTLVCEKGDPKALMRHLALDFHSWESILLVGHEPDLSQLIGVLTAGEKHLGLELEKGGLAKLSADSLTYDKCAQLDWLLTPRILRSLA